MATHKLLLLPGDGIGPEVMAEVKRLIDWLGAQGIAHFATEQGLVGGSDYDASQQSITDATMAQADAADAVIFGAVGGPKWDSVPYEARPDAGLLRLGDRIWFRHVVPLLGGLLSDRSAYRYLPKSTAYLPSTGELRTMLAEAGFSAVNRRALSGGLSQLITATRSGRP